ncbi:MAG: hypothetical protein NEA02_03665 [Thermoanaerobaculia bacterium]|nr:hypothetical protein [Thermoanaerobaculia bacterium]
MRVTSSLLLAGLLSASSPAFAAREATKEVLPFIADDYPKALAAARAGKKPIFLETWAPW